MHFSTLLIYYLFIYSFCQFTLWTYTLCNYYLARFVVGIEFFGNFQLIVNLANLPIILPHISANHSQTEKRQNVWILNGHSSNYFTRLIADLISVIWPFTLTALIVGSCLCCALIEFMLGILLSFCEKVKSSLLTHPCNQWLTFAQYKHDPKVKAVRVNASDYWS